MPSRRRQEAERVAKGLAACEKLDGFAGVRNRLRELATGRDEWAGFPLPLDDLPLVVSPKMPWAEAIGRIGRDRQAEAQISKEIEGCTIRNTFWSWRWRSYVMVWEEGGKIRHGIIPRSHGVDHILSTIGAADAWGIEQEGRAVDTLGKLLEHRKFKQYLLTGMFMEKSERSGVVYVFRRLRPTVAISLRGDKCRILAALCQHPIAYYEGSWAGAMTPTDDVIAHLMLMRADEHLFWKRSNQHPAWEPAAGI